MSQHWIIVDALRPEELEAFHDMIRDPKTTINAGREWLAQRECFPSRSAVGHYFKWFKCRVPHAPELGRTDARVREQILDIVAKLHGDDLRHFAMYGMYLRNVQLARRTQKEAVKDTNSNQ